MDLFLLKRFTVQKCLPEVPKGLKPIASLEKRCSWNMKNKWKPCGELSTHAYLTAKWKESLRSTRVVFGCTELLVAPTCMPLLSPPPHPNDPLRSAGKHQSPKLHHEQNIFLLISGTDRLRDANSITVSGWHICFQREDQEGSMMDGVSISSAANNLIHTHTACFCKWPQCCFSVFIWCIKCSILDIPACSLFALIWCRQLMCCHVPLPPLPWTSFDAFFTFLCQSIVLLCPMPFEKMSPWWVWNRNAALSSAVWGVPYKTDTSCSC